MQAIHGAIAFGLKRHLMAILQVLHGTALGEVFGLNDDRIVIGRHPECDIVVDSAAVSWQHAVVLRLNDDFYLEDLKSLNGTYLNGEFLRERVRLVENDHVQIGDMLFVFYGGNAPSSGSDQSTVDVNVSWVEALDESADNLPTAMTPTRDVQSGSIAVSGESYTSILDQWACPSQYTLRTPQSLVGLTAKIAIIPCATLFLTHSLRATSVVFVLVLLYAVWRVFSSLYWDNRNLQVVSDAWTANVSKALLYWCPVFLLMVPAVIIAMTIDVLFDRVIDLIEVYAYELSQLSQTELRARVDSLNTQSRPWYHYIWPPSLISVAADGIKLQIFRAALSVAPAIGIVSRVSFALLHTLLTVGQIVTLSILFLLLLRSFFHVLFRVWLRKAANSIEFRLVTEAEANHLPSNG